MLYFCKKNGPNMAISDTKFHNKYRIQSTRAEWHDYNGGLYHVTLCTKNREHYFGEIADGIMYLSETGEYVINWKSDKSCC